MCAEAPVLHANNRKEDSKMKKFHVGIQLYGLRNAMAADFEGTLKAVADMGYEYVEFAGYYGKSAEEIKAVWAQEVEDFKVLRRKYLRYRE